MPPRIKKPTGPTPVDATRHADKRVNLPTADAQVFVGPDVAEVPRLRWDRDPSLDPQLVWRGKDDLPDALFVDAPPIFIQEKIDPQALVENLRRTAEEGEPEPEATLFDTFDGLDELDLVDFYRHDANWSNRMILGDSLQVMASLAERERLRGKVQMIYIDPPYGIKFDSNWQASTRGRSVKDGDTRHVSREVEQIRAFRDTWGLGIGSYLTYLRDRCTIARDLLTTSGSIFIQIGEENVHLVRSLLDEVFGRSNFLGQIPFRKKTMPLGTRYLEQMDDYLIWYARDSQTTRYRQLYKPQSVQGDWHYQWAEGPDGDVLRLTPEQVNDHKLVPPRYRIFMLKSLEPSGRMDSGMYPYPYRGKIYMHPANGYATPLEGMQRLEAAGRLAVDGNRLTYRLFADDYGATALTAPWQDTIGPRDKVFVVQTSAEVVKRCLLMTTDPGDLVLDPTCGSGTTAYVAETWGRRWITMDTSRVALALARQRLMGARFPYFILADSALGQIKRAERFGGDRAPETPTNDIRRGFVYEQLTHLTLKSIANNPEIRDGLTDPEIQAAIRRHTDAEVLYDQPYEDKRTVRVAGPFTVESLSPHRSLAFSPPSQADTSRETISEHDADVDPGAPSFEQTVLDNLVRAGVQNGRRAERVEFASLESHAGEYIQAVGEQRQRQTDGEDASREAAPSRIAVALGPQYGTVSPGLIKAAAKEAISMEDVDLLCVLGFAFDPTALGTTVEEGVAVTAGDEVDDALATVAGQRRLGRLPILFVRMNADLLMGEALKKTGAGNLFTVFGEPDIEVCEVEGGRLVVELRGVDVYDPTTGEVRSGGTGQVALWMLDTRYDEESFFVRHCYFTGGNDPLKRLKTALKADIDADAWASLYDTVSRPFDKPDTGKIAVKVINDYGDEVLKVYEV